MIGTCRPDGVMADLMPAGVRRGGPRADRERVTMCRCPGCDEMSCGLPDCDECKADQPWGPSWPDGRCDTCWGSGWLEQFITPCPDCKGTGYKQRLGAS